MIRLENVSKYYVGNNEVALGLRKINLEFTEGELVAITGESGSGKSTLLNVLSGSDTYEEGELYIEGKPTSYFDETDWEHYRRDYIGFIYQNYNLIDSYSVFENVSVALMIKGGGSYSRAKVMDYLDRVGLREHAHKKATQLSSGQKQRLAIARALAKETKILVADEPTGNLDSQNSAEVMALLNELAVDKLVFVVTHNYDEIEQYATRKIRMYDGEVAEDLTLREKKLSHIYAEKNADNAEAEKTADRAEAEKTADRAVEEKTADSAAAEKTADNAEAEKTADRAAAEKTADKAAAAERKKVIRRIAALGRRSRPVTSLFLLCFMTIAAAAFYILLGSFFSNLDNTTSKVFADTQFTNGDTTRIVVRKEDGSTFSKAELNEISDIRYVEQADMYDCMGDTYYMTEEKADYDYYYNVRAFDTMEPSYIRPYALKTDKFMKSMTCLTEDDLSAGELGEGLYDIVMYSEDENIIGTTVKLYLGNKNMWNADIIEIRCTVTGILEEETGQIYFSEKLGSMLQNNPNKYVQKLVGRDSGLAERISRENVSRDTYKSLTLGVMARMMGRTEDPEPVYVETENEEEYIREMYNADKGMALRPIFVVNEQLTYNEVKVSDEFAAKSYSKQPDGSIQPLEFSYILRLSLVSGLNSAVIADSEATELYIEKNENMGMAQVGVYDIALEAQSDMTFSTGNVIEVSEELYEDVIGYSDSDQLAVYIKDYAYTDSVLGDIKEMGYEAASVYRTAAVEYDMELVHKKAVSMGISLAAFVMMFLIGVFIMGMIMALRMRDFNILRLLGMEKEELNQVNKNDIIINTVTASAIALIIIAVLNILNISYIADIVKYYKLPHYAVYAAAVSAFALLLNVRSRARVKKL